jgi:integrase
MLLGVVTAHYGVEGDRFEALYHLAIGSGMRQGEMFGLHWSSMDLAAGTVSVHQALSEISGKLTLTEPKSAKSRRMITLPQHSVVALEQHRKRQMAAGFGGVDYVFCNQSGGPMRRSHFHAENFRPLLKRGRPLADSVSRSATHPLRPSCCWRARIPR